MGTHRDAPVPRPAEQAAPEAAPLVSLDGVSFGYSDALVLRDVTLRVLPGALTGVVGPSGSGKTSLLKLVLGIERPTAGRVTRAPGTAVSYVPQVESVDWSFPVTVEQCVLMSRPTRRLLPRATAQERRDVMAVLERLSIAHLARRHVRELSGGQQQRMFLARALLRRPTLLLLDEPTSGVDIATRHEVLHLLQDLNREGLAVVLTTHDLNGLAAHLPHLVALQHRVVAEGAPAEVIRADVLEQTFGARMDVLQHLGMPVVVESHPGGAA